MWRTCSQLRMTCVNARRANLADSTRRSFAEGGMTRSRLFDGVRRAFQLSRVCDAQNLSTRAALELRAEREYEAKRKLSRRAFACGVAAGAGALLTDVPMARALGGLAAGKRIAI